MSIVLFNDARPKVNKAQLSLYALMVDAVKNNYPITEQDLIKLFKETHSCRTWDKWHTKNGDVWVGGYRPLDDWSIKTRARQWLKITIGALAVKGVLSIIPKFNISDIDDNAITN